MDCNTSVDLKKNAGQPYAAIYLIKYLKTGDLNKGNKINVGDMALSAANYKEQLFRLSAASPHSLRFVPGFPLLSGIASADELLSCGYILNNINVLNIAFVFTTDIDQQAIIQKQLECSLTPVFKANHIWQPASFKKNQRHYFCPSRIEHCKCLTIG